MKILFLNCCSGDILQQEMTAFVENMSKDVDIFCFQESLSKDYWLFSDCLKSYRLIKKYKETKNNDNFALSIFVNRKLNLKLSKSIFEYSQNVGLVLWLRIETNGKYFDICNVHGVSKPGDKLDTKQRIRQSNKIIDFLKIQNSRLTVIGGDFNLDINTQSVNCFENNGYRNLIKDFNINTTRNKNAWAKYPNNKQYFADYVFINSEKKVSNFEVLDCNFSDHLPMIIEFNV